ncbi:MAG: C-type lectin domain-containing protein [Myxococcales bacterium]|nr:C-type lectin domain-containing protein [Myxococcales bacterium]
MTRTEPMSEMPSFVPKALASLLLLGAACTTQVGGPGGESDIGDIEDLSDAVSAEAGATPAPDALVPFEGPCGEGDASFETGDGICFEYFFEDSSWAGARLKCQILGGDLARIDDAGTNGILASLVPTAFPEAWLLGSDTASEGVWTWDGEPMSYQNWRAGEPNNGSGVENCLQVLSDQGGTWDDRNCNDLTSYICQR